MATADDGRHRHQAPARTDMAGKHRPRVQADLEGTQLAKVHLCPSVGVPPGVDTGLLTACSGHLATSAFQAILRPDLLPVPAHLWTRKVYVIWNLGLRVLCPVGHGKTSSIIMHTWESGGDRRFLGFSIKTGGGGGAVYEGQEEWDHPQVGTQMCAHTHPCTTHTRVGICSHTKVHAQPATHIHTHVHTSISTYRHVHLYTHACTHICTHTHEHAHYTHSYKYIYEHTCTSMHICAYTHIHIHTSISIHNAHLCRHVHAHMRMHTHVHIHTSISMHTHVHTQTSTHTHAYTHKHAYYTYTHIHTSISTHNEHLCTHMHAHMHVHAHTCAHS